MAAIVALLLAAGRHRPALAVAAELWFRPGVDFVHRWLPLWYIPAIVGIPLAIQPLSGAALAKAAALVLLGIPLVLWFTAGVALVVRKAVKTEPGTFTFHAAKLEVTWLQWAAWGGTAAVSLLLAAVLPGVTARYTAFPFLLAAAVLGYMAGMALPPKVQLVVHPILVCGAAPNAGAALLGLLTGAGYWGTLQGFVTRGQGGVWGAGDLLFSFLGVVILSFGFKVYEQWPVMRRHAVEILAATASSSLFAMLTTAGMARAAGLPPAIARGLVPRSVTMALALPIAEQLDAPQPITAAAVALTGTAGSLVVRLLLDAARFKDPIARGLAAAAAAHGFGTAALSAREPETLPYCALSYAMSGVTASLWAALPPRTMAKKVKTHAAAEEAPEQAAAAAQGGGSKQAKQQQVVPVAEGAGKRRNKKRRHSKQEEQQLPQDELARRERQRKLRDLALRLRAEGKVYKKGKQRKHKPRRKVQLIIVPIIWQKKRQEAAAVLGAAEKVQELLRGLGVKCDTDTTTELTPGQKFRHWEEKGIMLRVELGPKEATEGTCILARCRKAGEVAQKQTLAVGPALCEKVKQQLEEMGETLAPPEAAAAPAAGAAEQQGAAEPAEDGQQAEDEEQQPSKKAKKGAAAAPPAEAVQPVAQQAQQAPRQQGKVQSAEDLEGDFAGVPLLGEQGPGKKGKKKQAAKAVVEAEVAAFNDLASGEGGEEGGKQKKAKKHKVVAF
ncbi:plastidal glycolate glycerate translocator chloroplastic [Chlorella sorokiniana]|uniref:Plastidal glycolate glycerate translocator chloroplastic n=1 Tax=Chlorella sorokiniana TaxID=3076 RepID=A0A2P6TIJ2_CHLSO|nr:plastidal glycolate glycerate translocator chloroplastic [Chlorella sorokiniana]|eukprot:PRW39064.1 plastidal glycolate glycerate translocator chloroplastic [Chlorella sorokiniana]